MKSRLQIIAALFLTPSLLLATDPVVAEAPLDFAAMRLEVEAIASLTNPPQYVLRNVPEVDPGKVGIAGCSSGGIITSTLIGIDNRYAFAIPALDSGEVRKTRGRKGASRLRFDQTAGIGCPRLHPCQSDPESGFVGGRCDRSEGNNRLFSQCPNRAPDSLLRLLRGSIIVPLWSAATKGAPIEFISF